VLRDREQMVAVRAYQRGIVMHVLHYLDEIRPVDELPEISSAKGKLDEKEVELGKTLVEQLTADEFDASQFTDAYSNEVEKLIEAKTKGKELIIAPEAGAQTPTKDLLEALKASVRKTGVKSKRQ